MNITPLPNKRYFGEHFAKVDVNQFEGLAKEIAQAMFEYEHLWVEYTLDRNLTPEEEKLKHQMMIDSRILTNPIENNFRWFQCSLKELINSMAKGYQIQAEKYAKENNCKCDVRVYGHSKRHFYSKPYDRLAYQLNKDAIIWC